MEAAEEAPLPAPLPLLPVTGHVQVRWADMEARLPCTDGKLEASVVNEELALSYVFPRCEVELCRVAPRGIDMRTAAWGECCGKDAYGLFFGLVPGETYWALVREHPEEVAKAEAARAVIVQECEAVMAARRAAEEAAEASARDARLCAQGEHGVVGAQVEQPSASATGGSHED